MLFHRKKKAPKLALVHGSARAARRRVEREQRAKATLEACNESSLIYRMRRWAIALYHSGKKPSIIKEMTGIEIVEKKEDEA